VCVCRFVGIYVFMYVCMGVCMCIYVDMYECVNVCMHVCVCVYSCMNCFLCKPTHLMSMLLTLPSRYPCYISDV
jgi:hypothetical protein